LFSNTEQILDALSRTGRRLALSDSDEYSLLVCGGSALNLSGLLVRPTRDVDVLGLVKGSKTRAVVEEMLPEELRRAAEAVALDLDLPIDWLNDAALEVHRMGLPKGILERADQRAFGPCLTVYLISRQDQVALKLYAALDREKGHRHLEDLVSIDPRRSEMESAAAWLLNRPTSPQFVDAIHRLAEGLGFQRLSAFKTVDGKKGMTNKKGKKRLKAGKKL
jgi:Nucleotidyltransferase of unknown function (DUF6036)